MTRRLSFPDGFTWGVATSSHQIEGAFSEGGRGESIWDRFAATPGRISDGSNAAVACDHYHRWRDDLALLEWLGVGAYRFSVAWPRVLPDGTGRVNTAGLDFYESLVDALLARGIEPFVTLYHWDLPQALEDKGGWRSRDTIDAFVEYTHAVTSRLGDRVRHWITHNEPWCIAHLGHEEGEHAPGHRDPVEAVRVAHHLLVSHGRAVDVIRRNSRGAEAGIVLNLCPAYPATPRAADGDAARWFDGFFNRWYLDPIFHGRYPVDAMEDRVTRGHVSSVEPKFILPGDMEAIAAPLDFLGINYYSRALMRTNRSGHPEQIDAVPAHELTEMGWEVFPQGLYDLLLRVTRDYAPAKIYITENGAAFPDPLEANGVVEDPRRVDYLRAHLAAAQRAVDDGVPLHGYFLWSLMDNFEWAHGYTKRFGVYRVDYETQRRIPKRSAHWYRDVARKNMLDALPMNHSRRTS
ncbi:MAG TPA: GH1 family beta-glucosidase [Candidatus Krumholzibacteria bacterium]